MAGVTQREVYAGIGVEALLRHELAGEGGKEESLSESPRESGGEDGRREGEKEVNETVNETMNETMNETVNETMNQSINQTMSQTMGQSLSHTINQSMSQVNHESMNQSMNHTMNHTISQSMSQVNHQSLNPSDPQPPNHSMDPSLHPSDHHSTHQSLTESTHQSMSQPTNPSMKEPSIACVKDSIKDSRTNSRTNSLKEQTMGNSPSMSLVEDSQEDSHGEMEEEAAQTPASPLPSQEVIMQSSLPNAQNNDSVKETAMEDASPASEKCTEASRCERIPAGMECTVIQVDLDLDNPEVSSDCREAEIRFYEELTESVNAVQKEDFTPQLFKQIHELIVNQKEPLPEAIMDMISEIADGLRSSFEDTVIESPDSSSVDKRDMITLEPLTMDVRSTRRREVSTVSITSEEKRIRLDECN